MTSGEEEELRKADADDGRCMCQGTQDALDGCGGTARCNAAAAG
jgi:hypothetical protein